MPSDEELQEEEGIRLVEPAQDVKPWRVRYGSGGEIAVGPQPTDIPWQSADGRESTKTIREIYETPIPNLPYDLAPYQPGRRHSLDDFVLTPDEFRQGYRLNTPVGPPVIPELTEELAARVDQIVSYIDSEMPRTAARLRLSPHLIFTMPELAAAVNTELTDYAGMDASPAVAGIAEALAATGDVVFKADSISSVLEQTEVSALFWRDYGDFFDGETRNMVVTLLANVPTRWRDRVSALAIRYMQENKDAMATSPEAMDQFIMWLWQETKRQQESEAFASSPVGEALDLVSKPYYAAQKFVSGVYNGIVAPEEVAWRNALTPGQTAAISMGADPSETGWSYKSGVIDFFGTFLWDPVNVAAGVGIGAKTARAFPLAAEAAQQTRLQRMLRTSVPVFGRQNADNLPVGSRSTWQRIGFHLFAKDAENLVEAKRFDSLYKGIADHFSKNPDDYAGLIDKYPTLRPLLGEGGGGLVRINSTDPRAVKEGFLSLLTQNSDTVVSTRKAAEQTLGNLRKRMDNLAKRAMEDGGVGADELTELEHVSDAGVRVIDSPYGQTRHVLTRDAAEAPGNAARTVWTEEPRIVSLRDEEAEAYFTNYMMHGSRTAEEATEAAFAPQALKLRRTEDAFEIDIVEPGPRSSVAEDFEQLTLDLRSEREGLSEVVTNRYKVISTDEQFESVVGDDQPHNWTRRIRILLDPDAPLSSIPEEVQGPLRTALYGALPENLDNEEAVRMVDEVLKAAVQGGDETIEHVAAVNNAKGLPVLYTGLGVMGGTEGVQTARSGYMTRSRLFMSPDVQAAGHGERPLSITEPFADIFPNALPTVTSAELAYGGFDDLGRQGTNFKPPTELILYTGRGEPKVLYLNRSNPEVRQVVREQFQYMWQPRESDIYGESWDTFVNNFVDMRDHLDETVSRTLGWLERNPNATETEFMERFTFLIDEALEEGWAGSVDDALAEFVSVFKKAKGREPSAQEISEWTEQFRMTYAQQALRQFREEDMGRVLADTDVVLPEDRAIEINFAATSEALFGDVVGADDADDIARIYRTKNYRAMFIEDQLQALVNKAEGEDWSDAVLLHELYGTLVSAGIEGRVINRTMRTIERQLAKQFDVAVLPRGRQAPGGPLAPAERRRAFLEQRREAWAKIDEEFGIGVEEASGPRIISGGQTGVDRFALEEAKEMGFGTGGTAPKGYKTDDGPDVSLADFGIREHGSESYVPRTKKNVDDAEVTIAFFQGGSVGTSKTVGYAQTGKWQGPDWSKLNRMDAIGVGSSTRGSGLRQSPVYVDTTGRRPVLVVALKHLGMLTDEELDIVGRQVASQIQGLGTVNVAGPRAKSLQPDDERRIRQVMRSAMEQLQGGEPRRRTISDLSSVQAKKYLAQKQAAERQLRLQQQAAEAGEDPIYLWLPKGGKKSNTYTVRSGYAKDEMHIDFTVPADVKTRAFMQKLYRSEVFLDLPRNIQEQILSSVDLPRHEYFGLGVGPPGSLDVPPGQRGIDEFVSESGQIHVTMEAEDPVGFQELRPRELGEFTDVNLEDPFRRPEAPLSIDAPVVGTEGINVADTVPDPTAEAAFRNVEGEMPPSRIPPTIEGRQQQLPLEMPAGVPQDAPAPRDFPPFTQEDMDLIVSIAQGRGYDAVELPGGFQVITPQGQKKTRLVRAGQGTGQYKKEIANLRKEIVKAETELTWAKSMEDKRFTVLKSMPQRESTLLTNMMMDLSRKVGRELDLDSHLVRTVRRMKAGLSDVYPEGVDITNTQEGYKQLNAFMNFMGVKPSTRQEWLNRFVHAPVSQRYGVLTDMINEVAEEIDHPLMRAGLLEWNKSGGVQSYSPTVRRGQFAERTLRDSRTRPGQPATSPARPGQLSRVFPLPGPDFSKMLTRYRRGKAMPTRVKFLSTIGGTANKRVEFGRKIASRLKEIDPDTYGNITDEEALIIGYANFTDPELVSAATRGVRSVAGGFWRWAHRGFTRVQLAARPMTWMFRVVFFDEMVRGALFDTPSLYRHPLEWSASVHDSYKIAQNQNYLLAYSRAVNDELITLFRNVDDVPTALNQANKIVPEFTRAAADLGFDSFDNPDQVQSALFQLLRLDLDDITKADTGNFGRRVNKFRRKAIKNRERYSKYDLPPGFTTDELVEIQQKGISNAVVKQGEASFEPMQWRGSGMMNTKQRELYGRAYGTQLHQFATDPWGKIALHHLASQEAGTKSNAAHQLMNGPHWSYMREEVIDVARYNGVEWSTDRELAQYWLDNVLVPEARELLTPIFDDLRVGALSMLGGRATARVGGQDYVFTVNKSNPGSMISTFEDMVKKNGNHEFPPYVAASFDLRYAMAQGDKNVLVKAADKIIDAFGEQTTQALNRRPAWLRTYRDEMRYMRSRGMGAIDGLDPKENERREWIIRRVAEQAANRRVNHVYFNMKDVPHYVQQMNRVIPFFSAMYEVTTSWAYKVPLAMSPMGWPSGVGVLGRKVDRVIQSLIRSGLIEVDDEPDEDSPTQARQLSLRIASDLPTNVDIAERASAGLRAMMKGPELIVRWIGSLTSAIDEPNNPFPDIEYRLGLGNPIDFGSHGFGSALQISAGMNPLGSALLGEVRRRTNWGADVQKVDLAAGSTLAEIAESTDKSVGEILNWNTDLLVRLGVFSQLEINEHMRGIRSLSDQEIGRDVSLRIPGSTVLAEMLDEVFFPFDQVESGVGVLNGYSPSWANFFLRGWGLHNAVGEDAPWQMTDDGEIVFDFDDSFAGGIANMWVNVMVPPETRVFMAGNITEALQHLEATEGVITSQFELVEEYNRLHEYAIDQGLRGIVAENGRFEPLETNDPVLRELADQLLAMQTQIENHNSMIVKRATEVAAFGGFVRGLAGFLGPANPRVLFEDAEKRSLYYNSRDAVNDARLTNGELTGVQLPEVAGVTEAKAFFTLANLWLNDQSGDASKVWLREQFPEIQPFLQGKTYWGPGGEPIESQTYTKYVEQIREGLRRPYPPEIAIMMQLKTANSIEREVAIIERYGNDPMLAAQAILSDYSTYRDEVQAEYQLRADYIDMLDDQMFDGKFEQFAEREMKEFPVFGDNLYRIFDDAFRDIELANQALQVDPLLDDSVDLREAADDLEAAARGLREIRRQFQSDSFDYQRNPREDLITQYFDEVLAPYWEGAAEFQRRIDEPGLSSQDRSRVFTEKRIWENQLLTVPLYLQHSDGSTIKVPNPIEYRAGSSGEENQRVYARRNLHKNPRWNNLFDNRQMLQFYPELARFIPTDAAEMHKYDTYDLQLNDIDKMWESGEITTAQKDDMKDALEERFREQLRTQGKPGEEQFMMDMTPAERFHAAGQLAEWPLLTQYASAVRETMDAAVAAGESPTGKYTMPVFKNMLAHMKQQWEMDPVWRERFIQWARDIGYEQVFLDEFFNQFFLGKFTGDL